MKRFLQAVCLGLAFILFCGFAYPLLVVGIGQIAFHNKVNGSMIQYNGKIVGSVLIGQSFKDARFFHGRVSAVNYNTFTAETDEQDMVPGSGSQNYAVSNPDLKKRIEEDVDAFLKENPSLTVKELPADLFTSSYSGLEPDISPAVAEIQIDGIAKATGIDKTRIRQIVQDNTTGRDLGIFGEPRVNVLKCNLAIYQLLEDQ